MAAATMLIDAERRGQLDLSETREMLDFGTGFGGPTLALVELAILNGGNVTGVDEKDNITGSLSDEKILDGDHYIIGDGLKVLENAASGYDLITAFMLGPDIDGQLSIKLIDLSRQSLKPKGKLLITSDHITIDFVTRACRYLNIDYRQVSPRYEGEVFSQGYIIITAAQKEEELEAAA